MEIAFADRRVQRASDLAYHLYQSGSAAPPDKTIRMLLIAAEQAILGSAFTEALDHCDRAATIDEAADRSLGSHLLRVRGAALKGLGRWPEACETLGRAHAGLYAAGDPAAPAVAFDLALLMAWATENGVAHQLCAHALEQLAESPSDARVRLLTLDAVVEGLLDGSHTEKALQRLASARAMAIELSDPSLVGFTYFYEAEIHWQHGRIDLAMNAAREGNVRLSKPADVQWRDGAAATHAICLMYAGRYDEMDGEIANVLRLANEMGNKGALLLGTIAHAIAECLRTGDLRTLDRSMRELDAGMTALGPYGKISLNWAAMSQLEQGDGAAALKTARLARLEFPTANQWTGVLDGCELLCLAMLGDPAWPTRLAACRHLAPVSGKTAFAGQRWFAIFLCLSHVVRDELSDAAALYPVLCDALDGGFRLGPMMPLEGLVGVSAAAGGQWELAERHFLSALALVEQNGDRLGKPSVQKWYAWMLLHRDAPGDGHRARVMLDEAIPSMRLLGMHASLSQAEALRARCGV